VPLGVERDIGVRGDCVNYTATCSPSRIVVRRPLQKTAQLKRADMSWSRVAFLQPVAQTTSSHSLAVSTDALDALEIIKAYEKCPLLTFFNKKIHKKFSQINN